MAYASVEVVGPKCFAQFMGSRSSILLAVRCDPGEHVSEVGEHVEVGPLAGHTRV